MSKLRRALLLTVLVSSSFSAVAAAQPPACEPASVPTPTTLAVQVASDDVEADVFDVARSETRRRRARRLRIAGGSMIAAYLVSLPVAAIVGAHQPPCGEDEWLCFRGPAWAVIADSAVMAPVFIGGVTTLVSGLAIERRERRRASVSATASGLRLTF